MVSASSIVLEGLLKSDGTIQLDRAPVCRPAACASRFGRFRHLKQTRLACLMVPG